MDYQSYYENQIGSGLSVFKGSKSQKGAGLGNVFRSFFKWVVPMFKTHALPLLKSGAETLSSEALRTATNVATDALAGKNIEEAARNRTAETINDLSSRLQRNVQSGSGYKRKILTHSNLINKKVQFKKRRVQDIFD